MHEIPYLYKNIHKLHHEFSGESLVFFLIFADVFFVCAQLFCAFALQLLSDLLLSMPTLS